MNATSPEKTETTETDENLAAVSDVEAGIRDFVRNDVAYLRRPGAGMASSEPALDSNAEATVSSVNSLIQRVAGTSLAEIERHRGSVIKAIEARNVARATMPKIDEAALEAAARTERRGSK